MEKTKNVGIWIRVSTDLQVQDESPEHHQKRAQNYADAKGWNVFTIYRLDALSGKSVMDYAETKRMLSDIKNGTITGIIFSKLARLARNTKELLEISELFRQQNADLISLAEAIDTSTPAGRLFFTIIAAMAQWEREEIAERVAASVPIRAKMGKPLGGQASFGYTWAGKELQVDLKEAPVRKLLYDIFLKTKRKKATASELNALGHRTRNGSLFTGTTVERLLKDPTAKGIRRANYTKSLGEGKNWVIKPQSEWIEMPCPAIVEETIWNDCNTILEQQTKKRIKVGPRTVHLLAGYVYCPCGTKMYVYTSTPTYKCKKCKLKIAEPDLDEIYHAQLQSFLLTDTDLETINMKSNQVISEKETLLKSIQAEHTKLIKRTEEQMNLRITGELSKEEFTRFYKPAEQQLRQIEQQMPELEAEIDFLKIQYLSSDTIIQDAKDLYTNWNKLPFEEKRTIVETITDRIDVDTESINIALSYAPTPIPSLNGGKKERNFIPVLPFCELEKNTYNWKHRYYPKALLTVGDHIRQARLERGLFQSQVATILQVSEDSVTYWENNRTEPQIQYLPAIIAFLGYVPLKVDTSTLAGRIRNFRLLKGLSLKKMAKMLNVDSSTVCYWEDNHEPQKEKKKLLEDLLNR